MSEGSRRFTLTLALLASAPALAIEEGTPMLEGQVAHTPYSFGVRIEAPYSSFGITAGGLDDGSGLEKDASITFVPVASSSIVSILAAYEGATLRYSQRLNNGADFNSIRVRVPIAGWGTSLSYQRCRRFKSQVAFGLGNTDSSSNLSYDDSLPGNRRDDVSYTHFSLQTDRSTSLARTDTTDYVLVGFGEAIYQSFRGDRPFIQAADRTAFGTGADISGVSAGGLGLGIGLETRQIAPGHSLDMSLRVGGRALVGNVRYGGGTQASFSSGLIFNGALGWLYSSELHSFSLKGGMDVSARGAMDVSFVSWDFWASAAYAFRF